MQPPINSSPAPQQPTTATHKGCVGMGHYATPPLLAPLSPRWRGEKVVCDCYVFLKWIARRTSSCECKNYFFVIYVFLQIRCVSIWHFCFCAFAPCKERQHIFFYPCLHQEFYILSQGQTFKSLKNTQQYDTVASQFIQAHLKQTLVPKK